jgi:hypothetical protein
LLRLYDTRASGRRSQLAVCLAFRPSKLDSELRRLGQPGPVAVVLGTKIARLGNGSIHSDRTRVVRASVGTRTAAYPTAKSESRTCVRFNGHTRSGVMPATGWLHCAASSRTHRQEVLRLELRRIGLVGRRSDNMRDRSVVTPFLPNILQTGAAALR